uniref:Phosphatidic acid phosphatase type 2/haloperoxidase domain-containing protein n=1 Tax=Octopus bimaculoides TaxID=37653 RepID=A0A0L8IGP0_OCTBM
MRRNNFSCIDAELSHSSKESLFVDFAFHAEVSDEAVYSLSVCVPPFVILISEIGMWAFSSEPQRSITILCAACRLPQIIRRIFRFIGVFLFGAMALMVFTDVIKLMTGRLRPNFLDICQVNRSKCFLQNQSGGDELCLVKNMLHLRNARTSFPSMNACLTSYAAVFLVIYIHYGVGTHTLKLVRVFLAMIFCMMSLLCGLVEIGLFRSYWTDVVAGFGMGVLMAAYLGGFVLHNFSEHTLDKKLLRALKTYLLQHGGSSGRPGYHLSMIVTSIALLALVLVAREKTFEPLDWLLCKCHVKYTILSMAVASTACLALMLVACKSTHYTLGVIGVRKGVQL